MEVMYLYDLAVNAIARAWKYNEQERPRRRDGGQPHSMRRD